MSVEARGLRWGAGCGALALVSLLAAPLVCVKARKDTNEAGVIGALKSLANAQVLYREGDKDGNGTLEYAPALSCLINTGPGRDENLIDEVLASGTKQGYVFAITSASAAGFTATAAPVKPGETGTRFFGINAQGEVFFATRGPVSFKQDGSSRAQVLWQ